MRKAAEVAVRRARGFLDELRLNRDLYEAFRAIDLGEDDETTRFVLMRILREYRRLGINLDGRVRNRIKEIRDEIHAAELEFGRNIREDSRSIVVDRPDDLEGLPPDFLDAHHTTPGAGIVITTQPPDAFPVFRFARRPDVRRRLMHEFYNTGHPANIETLHRLLTKRHELARLLGYEHFAALDLEDTMAGTGERVEAFLERLARVARAAAAREYEELLEEKRREHPEAESLDAWDFFVTATPRSPYLEDVRARRSGFDAKLLRPYLALDNVRDGLFSSTSTLLGVECRRVSNAPAWDPSVEVYDVFEETGQVGRLYLDLHARGEKRHVEFATPVVIGIRGLQLPQAALSCSFAASAAPKGAGPPRPR